MSDAQQTVAVEDDDFIFSTRFIETPDEEFEWVIKPLCVRGSGMMIYGRQGVGKSSITTQLCHSLMTGEPFLGFPVMHTGYVLYLHCDMNGTETKKVLRRGYDAGLCREDGLLVPNFEKHDGRFRFNILDPVDQTKLALWCERWKPIAVVVDNIHDAYVAEKNNTDVNAVIRSVYRGFQDAIGGAVLIMLNHARKQSAIAAKLGEEDDDAFMGGQAWEGLVATSIRVSRDKKTHKMKMSLQKTRLGLWPEAEILLDRTKHGFFSYQMPYNIMLTQWPDCIPNGERDAVIAATKTKADVFKDIARRTGVSYDTIRKYENAHRDLEYPWRLLVQGSDSAISADGM